MSTAFLKAVENRRSHYALSHESRVTDVRIREILETAIKHAPSAFHSQTARVVLLNGEEHHRLWEIVLETLKAIVPADAFETTRARIEGFDAAHATILFFEEQETVAALQERFPLYAHHFPNWSEQASGMLQYVIWTALEDEGLGASVQHYNPLIDEKVKAQWGLPASWRLVSQMPFGNPTAAPSGKEHMPVSERLRILG